MTTTVDLTCARGDTATWNLVATKDGDPIDLTGGRVVFAVRRNYASALLFERSNDTPSGITISTPATLGHAVIKLLAADTMALANEDTVLVYTVHVITAAGDKYNVARGKLSVSPIAWDGTT